MCLCKNKSTVTAALNKFTREFRKHFNEMIDSAMTDRTAYKLSVLKNVIDDTDLQSYVFDNWTKEVFDQLDASFSSARTRVSDKEFKKIKNTLVQYLFHPKNDERNLYRYDDAIDLKTKTIMLVMNDGTRMGD